MRRRTFIGLMGAAAAFPRVALAQQGAKSPRIAYLSLPQNPAWNEAFLQGLSDYGYVNGKNITVEFFIAAANNDLATLATAAVATKPDIVATSGTSASLAA